MRLKTKVEIIVAIFIAIIALIPNAVRAGTYEDFEYDIQDDEVIITKMINDEATDVVVPEEIDGHRVTTIGEWSFSACTVVVNKNENGEITSWMISKPKSTNLTTVSLPSSIKHIENNAFYYCTSLTDINIPNAVTDIGNGTFEGCTKLTSIQIPNSVTSIGGSTFASCSNLINVSISNNITSISSYMFSNCIKLTSIEIPSSVTTIEEYAFSGCTSLATINISKDITNISDSSFENCTGLECINVEQDNHYFMSQNGVLFNNAQTELIKYPSKKNGNSYDIPENVTNIGSYAFDGSIYLTHINIPNKVTYIGSGAFRNCIALTNIDIPNSVTYINYGAFENCISLENIVLSNNIEEISDYVFKDCTSLTNIEIPNNIKSIYEVAFSNCTNLILVKIPDSVTHIDGNAFSNCNEDITFIVAKNSYAESYVINNNLKYIIDDTEYVSMNDCELKEINVNNDNQTIEIEEVVKYGEQILERNKDYKVNYTQEETEYIEYEDIDISIGKITIDIIGMNTYVGKLQKIFVTHNGYIYDSDKDYYSIRDCEIEEIRFTECSDQDVQTEEVIKHNGKILEKNKDYKIKYLQNDCDDEVRVNIIGIGDYQSIMQKKLEKNVDYINDGKERIDISECEIETLRFTQYSDQVIETEEVVKDGDTILEKGTDYKVKYTIDTDNDEVKIIIIGIGDYTGKVEEIFAIDEIYNQLKSNELQAMLDELPDTIEVKLNNTNNGYYSPIEDLNKIIKDKINGNPEDYDVDCMFEWVLEDGYIGANTKIVDVTLRSTKLDNARAYKSINIEYVDWNETDNKNITDKIKSIDNKLLSIHCEYDIEKNIGFETLVQDYYTKLLGDDTINCGYLGNIGGGELPIFCDTEGEIIITKNSVPYFARNIGIQTTPLLIIPDNIENNDSAYIDYAKPIIQDIYDEYYKDDTYTISLKKGEDEDKYIITQDGEYQEEIEIVLRKKTNTGSNTTDISKCTISDIPNQIYTGSAITPNVIIKNGDTTLAENTDYTISYSNNINAGTASVTINCIGNYTGTKTIEFTIDKATYDMSNLKFEDLIVTYDGKSHSINATGMPAGINVKYINNNKTDVGTYIVTAEFTGDATNYNTIENTTATLTINAKDISNVTTIVDTSNKTYTGKAITTSIELKDGSTILKENTAYTVSYKNNKDVGTATVTITGIGNYTGTKTAEFTIEKAIYDMSKLKFDDLTVTYDGKSHSINASGVPSGVKVTYQNNNKTNVGTYKVTAIFSGDETNYNVIDNKTATLTINAKDISKVTTIVDTSNKTYTGKAITTSVEIKDGSTILKENTAYTISYKDNKDVGTASVTITGKGNYIGTITKKFKIVLGQIKDVKTKTQTDNAITIQWKKDTTATGYEVYMSTSKNGKYSKITTIKKNSTTSFKKTDLKAGKTYYFKVRAYKTINKKDTYGSYSSILTTTTKTATPKISKVTAGTKKATIKWSKVSGTTGYEVYMATSKNGKYSKKATIANNKTFTYTQKKLAKGKTYYFKIRTYRLVDGKKVYSSYSSVKSVKIKK